MMLDATQISTSPRDGRAPVRLARLPFPPGYNGIGRMDVGRWRGDSNRLRIIGHP